MNNLTISINAGDHRARVVAKRDRLVVDNLSLAEGIARGVCRRLPPIFQLDDLVATANLALVRAATRYRPGAHNGAPFGAYARMIVRGAVLDSVRRKNWTESMRPGLYAHGKCSGEPDVEQEIDAMVRAATQPVAPAAIDRRRLVARVSAAIACLSPKAQAILREYYSMAEPRMQDVADKLHLTRSHAQWIHKNSIIELRARLKRAA